MSSIEMHSLTSEQAAEVAAFTFGQGDRNIDALLVSVIETPADGSSVQRSARYFRPAVDVQPVRRASGGAK